jgi:hypothetical protein
MWSHKDGTFESILFGVSAGGYLWITIVVFLILLPLYPLFWLWDNFRGNDAYKAS